MKSSLLFRLIAVCLLLVPLCTSNGVAAAPYKKYTKYTRALAHGRNRIHRPSYTPYNRYKNFWIFSHQ